MAHPQMPNIPGAAVMTDTLDFVKSLWGSMSVPGLTAPTLSVEELDKKISDLKAVETWLNLNMSMLRGSIQALEVQRGTIATLKSVGASLAAAVNQPQSSDHKSIFDANPYASAFFHHAREADKDKDKAAAPAPAPAPAAAPAAPAAAEKPAAEEAAKPSAAPMTNPAIWWNMLQDQFKQAVSTAMASESMMATAAARATDTAAKFAAAATQPAAKAKPAAAATPATASAAPKKAPAKKRAPVKKAAADKA
ncbi:hypothetical protein D0T25_22890 [Duganella sp. BJB488]|uniref:PhaM family polyhydroxyalkanoate granule multifunctional regulatory protein n=1 Tax=unclassified Duganella TaxID=2636909 RepID=UPI000E35195E|nr:MULTISPECIES: PhaM family polyhydroxyalkanoate granule multifunctional regulatory protein [unclassified Duganella]RFP13993.1 hypothetical protein D0T26_21685 [Duganella sp. BJB489]RFP17422.1 hypothetical protein D0T25_22890 [Duganella sp. BJB488]RFP31788.1 hypothetical protein D0T24_23025 [Duganella sp. BJB480]